MSYLTSIALSFNNLKTKFKRTLMVAIAGSIGIIGIALILGLSNGVSQFIKDTEEKTMISYPIEIDSSSFSIGKAFENTGEERTDGDISEVQTIQKMLSAINKNDLASLKEYFENDGKAVYDYSKTIEYKKVLDLDYDYKMSGEHKGQVVASWSQHDTANPIVDIQKAQLKIATDTGTKPNRLIMNSVTFNNLMMNKAIKKDMNILSGEHIILTEEMVKQYMKSKLQVVIQIYDKMFKDETGADKKYIPDSTVAIIPEGTLGKTMFGTTPEESDLMSGTDADVSIVNTGMAITTTKKTDPVNVETKVSMITLPSFERMDELFILDTEL